MCDYNEYITKCRQCAEIIRVFKGGWDYCKQQGSCTFNKKDTFIKYDMCGKCRSQVR
ncbi:hypothetical protein AAE478_007911 [Parahypoxylon ruwenzoriense]